jgi:hypothetical protein
MGWVIQDYRGHRLVSHGGAIDGFRAHVALAPEDGLGIVLLNNLDRTQMNLALSNSILDLLLSLPSKDWNAFLAAQVRKGDQAAAARARERELQRHRNTQPTLDLAAYAGVYADPAYGKAEVRLEAGKLVWKWSTFTADLQHYHHDTFTARDDTLNDPRVVFILDQDSAVVAMKVMDVMDVEFKKSGGARRK